MAVSRTPAGFTAAGKEWPPGTFLIRGEPAKLDAVARGEGLTLVGVGTSNVEGRPLRLPRVGLYKSWTANIDEGWTRWILERYGFAYESLSDADVRQDDLSWFDVIVLPSQSRTSLLHGHQRGTMPPEYTGGIGLEGALRLKEFVQGGGLLLTLDQASDLAIDALSLPVEDAVQGLDRQDFFIPGSLVRMRVDASDPIAYGMPEEAAAFFVRSRAFRVAGEGSGAPASPSAMPVDVVARYADDDLLLSGWELGARRYLSRMPAVVRVSMGRGQVVMVGFRSQFRAQPRSTFKLLFNTLYAATMAEWPAESMGGGE